MKARRTLVRTVATALAAGALAWVGITGGSGAGSSDANGTNSTNGTNAVAMKAVAEEGPGYAVEDFGYPNADKILAEKKITLKRGDGHILLADCGSAPDLMEVWTRQDEERFCFKITGNQGYLALELPAVYSIKGNNYSAEVDMTVGTEEKSFDIRKNAWTPVGESVDPQARDFMLMEIRASK
ncbi:hypothetical protein [Streptomyces sp. NPDC058579]|uniref:hypothetical protein n=1 Tax=Streptomyces sp. NPDC058579 TaxID=3346548 RepID=UPI003664D3FB